MKIIFDRSQKKLKDFQFVLCTKRPDTWCGKVKSGCIARYEGLNKFNVAVDTIIYKGVLKQIGTYEDSFIKISEIKYQKGDIVYCKNDNKKYTIVDVPCQFNVTAMDEDGVRHSFQTEELFPAPLYMQPNNKHDEYNIQLNVNEPIVTASLTKQSTGEKIAIAHSICSSDYKFDVAFAVKVAINRLLTNVDLNVKNYKAIDDLPVGRVFKYCGRRWVKFNKNNDCMCCESVGNLMYDDGTVPGMKRWSITSLYKELVKKLSSFAEEEDLDYTDRDIIADDGSAEYLSCTKVRLITCEEWRNNYHILTNAIDDVSFWTMTPDSKVTNTIRAMLFNIGFVPRHPSNIFDVLPVIRLKSYVRVGVYD